MQEVKVSQSISNDSEKSKTSSKKLTTLGSYTGKTRILEIFAWIVLVAYMTPFYLMFINSFKTRREIFSDTTGLPSVWNVSN